MANTATTKQILDNLTFDTEVYTAAGVDQAISDALVGGYKIKGNATVAELNTLAPSVAQASATLKVGDTYNLTTAGTLAAAATTEDAAVVKGDNVVWTEDGWDLNRGLVDLTVKQDKITASGLLKGDGSGGVTAAVAGTDYVAPVSGKGLSTNDYTTAEKNKLADIAVGANVGFSGIEGTTGTASVGSMNLITFSGTNASVNVSQITSGAKVDINVPAAAASAAGVVKLSDATDGTAAAASGATAATPKAVASVASALSTHAGNTTVHVTAAERTAWNNKASTDVASTSANGLMSKEDKSKLDGIASGANLGFASVTGYNGNTQGDTATGSSLFFLGSGNLAVAVEQVAADRAAVTLNVPDASTSGKGAVQLSNSTSDTSTSKAATASAVKSAYDRGSAGVTAAAAEKTKRNAVATALSTHNALTQSSPMSDVRALVNALLSALKVFGADS